MQKFSSSFWCYLFSRFCSGIAVSLIRTAMIWHIWNLTKSEIATGMLGLFMFVPGVSLALVGGAFADAHDRRRIIQIAQSIAILGSIFLAVLSFRDQLVVEHIYALAVLFATCAAFETPSRAALVSQVVARDILQKGITWASTAQALSFATGPAIAGVVISFFGVSYAYLSFFTILIFSVIALFFVKLENVGVKRAASWAAIREGLVFVKKSPVLIACMTLDLVAVILGGVSALLPVFSEKILNVGPKGYGILAGAAEVGALLMSIVILRMPQMQRAGRWLLISVGIYGVATIAFGFSEIFYLSVFLLALCGGADQISVVLRNSAVQLNTPDELRGRVSAVSMVFIISSNQLSVVESGFVAALIGPKLTVIFGGIGVVITVITVAILVPTLRRFSMKG